MAKGYPDYFGQPIFPKYGALKSISGNVDCPIGVTTTLFTIAVKGRITGGIIYTSDADSNIDDTITIVGEGSALVSIAWTTLNAYGLGSTVDFPIKLLSYDRLSPSYCANIAGDISFTTSFGVQYTSNLGTVTVSYIVFYQEIVE